MSRLLLVLLMLWVGCGDDASGAPGDGGGGATDGTVGGGSEQLPCDVADVISRNCLGCHQDPPVLGAPMPLTGYEEVHAPAKSMPMQEVRELMRVRINSTTDPMPPPPAILPDADRAILNAWLDGGAQPRPAGETCGGTGTDGGAGTDAGGPLGGVGPEHLPCTPSYTFTAHASGSTTEGFPVPADAGNLYRCFTFRPPFTDGQQATAWAPIIDDTRVIHHWILYATESTLAEGTVGGCNKPADSEFLMGWAPGGGNAVLPSNVGLELPETGTLILEVHYWNVAGHTDAVDASGVAMCTTDPGAPRENEAGVLWLGSINIDIPARATGHTVVGNCPSSATNLLSEPLYILGQGPHMHELGTRFTTKLFRGGDRSSEQILAHVDPWDFNSQAFYWHDEPIRLDPGDALETTCVYDNPGDSNVSFGERTEDEMCFDFVMVYPTRAFFGDQRRCVF